MDQAAARVRLRTKTKPQDTKALEDELRRVQRERMRRWLMRTSRRLLSSGTK